MISVNHQWHARAPIIPGRDSSYIPGLNVDKRKNEVFGPWDAVHLYCNRDKIVDPVISVQRNASYDLKVRNFQRYGIDWLITVCGHVGSALLADEMGLGKTLQVIKAADTFGGLRLVVCPRSVALTWVAEIKKWSDCMSITNVMTREETSKVEAKNSRQWIIVSYDLLPYLNTGLRATTVIADEAHNFAGRKAKRGKKLLHLGNLAENKIAITGTPIWSRPRDYWMLFKFLFGSTFGSAWDFDEAYCGGKLNEYGGMSNKGATRTKELKHRVSFYQLRRLKKDVAKELPKLTRSVRWLDANPKASAAMKNAYLHKNKGAQWKALLATADFKMEAVMDAAADCGSFIIATGTKRHARFMQQGLEDRGVPCSLLTGEVSPKERNALIAHAAKRRHGIVATIDCIKEGVDGLQHVASTMLVHTLDFVPLKLLQLEKRLDRIGQTLPVSIIYFMLRESMDQWVNETVVQKLAQWGSLVHDVEGGEMEGDLSGRRRGQSEESLEKEVLKQIYRSMRRS